MARLGRSFPIQPHVAGTLVITPPLDLSAALTRLAYTRGGNRPNPLIANTNTAGAYDEVKAGPRPVLKRGNKDWVMMWESVASTASLTQVCLATSNNVEDWTKYAGNPVLVPNSGAWQNNELSPNKLVWDPVGGRYLLYGHGGNNTGPRQVFVAESKNLTSWTILNGGNPILAPGSAGQWDDNEVDDSKVIRFSATDWVMYYRGGRTTSQSHRIGYATSSDGITWTKYGSNPVLSPGAGGAWDNGELIGPSVFLDPNGTRIHLWYAGINTALTAGIGYAYTDNRTTFTKGASNPVLVANTDSAAPDADSQSIGDTLEVVHDGDKLYVTYGTDRVTGYTPLQPLRGACAAFIGLPATSPRLPGRFFKVSTDKVTPGGSAYLMNDSVFTLCARFKMPAAEGVAAGRPIYNEIGNFDEEVNLGLFSNGTMQGWYRTPGGTSGICELISTARYDDNRWHNVAWRRTALGNFDLVADATTLLSGSQPTPATATPVSPPMIRGIGADTNSNYAIGTISRIAMVEGTAWTNAQIESFLNGGDPATTPTWWYDLGSASPETDKSGNGNSGTVTGTTVVSADPSTGSIFTPSGIFPSQRSRRIFMRSTR